MDVTAVERLIFAARHRVVLDAAPAGDGAAVARQLDAVLMCAGFKCSRQLLEGLAGCGPEYLIDKAVQVIGWAKWLHFYLRGVPTWGGGVRVEENKLTVKILARSVLARDYLRVGYLAGLLRAKADAVTVVNGDGGFSGDVIQGPGPVTYLGVAEPPGLPDGSVAYTLGNLSALIPA